MKVESADRLNDTTTRLKLYILRRILYRDDSLTKFLKFFKFYDTSDEKFLCTIGEKDDFLAENFAMYRKLRVKANPLLINSRYSKTWRKH